MKNNWIKERNLEVRQLIEYTACLETQNRILKDRLASTAAGYYRKDCADVTTSSESKLQLSCAKTLAETNTLPKKPFIVWA